MITRPKPNGYQSVHLTVDMNFQRGTRLDDQFTIYNRWVACELELEYVQHRFIMMVVIF